MNWTADFETTTDEKDCRVWAFAVCEIGNPEHVEYGNNIDDFIKWCRKHKSDNIYFHNLKFDGEFIISWLLNHGYKHNKDSKNMEEGQFSTLISDKGQFYIIKIQFTNKQHISFYDSLKIIPFSVKNVAKTFGLPISKLEIDYTANRDIGHILTDEEKNYIKNDVQIMSLALDILFKQNLKKITQGSNALNNYKEKIGKKRFEYWFPKPAYDNDIRQSYKGGFTYLDKRWINKDVGQGIVLDVNSLYPSVMRNRPMPYGEGKFFEGQYVYDEHYPLYIQMLTCHFYLKENYIPTIQIKHNLSFIPTQYLESSIGESGEDEEVTLCLTNVDLELFMEHYYVFDITYHSGWKFRKAEGMFNDYIDYWINVKIDADREGNKGMRTMAKLMLNSLYGKFCA